MARALATHDRLISTVVVDHGGRLVRPRVRATAPKGVFDSPAPAVVAALELQRALAAEPPAKATPKIVDHRATATGCHLETNPSARR